MLERLQGLELGCKKQTKPSSVWWNFIFVHVTHKTICCNNIKLLNKTIIHTMLLVHTSLIRNLVRNERGLWNRWEAHLWCAYNHPGSTGCVLSAHYLSIVCLIWRTTVMSASASNDNRYKKRTLNALILRFLFERLRNTWAHYSYLRDTKSVPLEYALTSQSFMRLDNV